MPLQLLGEPQREGTRVLIIRIQGATMNEATGLEAKRMAQDEGTKRLGNCGIDPTSIRAYGVDRSGVAIDGTARSGVPAGFVCDYRASPRI